MPDTRYPTPARFWLLTPPANWENALPPANLPAMQIRPATAADVPSVIPMVNQLAALHEAWDPARFAYLPDPGNRYRSWLSKRAEDPRSVLLVAVAEDGRVVGFVVGTVEREIPIYRIEEFGFIHDLWVDEPYRNEGVGRQLVMAAVEAFGNIGAKQVRCETASPNVVARELFARCGFRASVTEMLLEVERS